MVPALQSYAGDMPEALQPLGAWLLQHTYLVVFVGALIDATGIPFPGRLILVAAGALPPPRGGHPVLGVLPRAPGAAPPPHLLYLPRAARDPENTRPETHHP